MVGGGGRRGDSGPGSGRAGRYGRTGPAAARSDIMRRGQLEGSCTGRADRPRGVGEAAVRKELRPAGGPDQAVRPSSSTAAAISSRLNGFSNALCPVDSRNALVEGEAMSPVAKMMREQTSGLRSLSAP